MSPILSNVIEVYNGLTTFRCYDKIDYIRKNYIRNIDNFTKIEFHDRMARIFVNLTTEIIIALFVGFSFYLIILGRILDWSFVVSQPALVAVTLNYVIQVPVMIGFYMFLISEMVAGMSSVQRILKNIDDSN